MVAYNFQSIFAPAIEDKLKLQTIRPVSKKRHVNVGEPMQLYSGMRTKNCKKIIDPDPVCIEKSEIMIEVSANGIEEIHINGEQLEPFEIDFLAHNDGFDPKLFQTLNNETLPRHAQDYMADFFRKKYGIGTFRGVLIKWKPAIPRKMGRADAGLMSAQTAEIAEYFIRQAKETRDSIEVFWEHGAVRFMVFGGLMDAAITAGAQIAFLINEEKREEYIKDQVTSFDECLRSAVADLLESRKRILQ